MEALKHNSESVYDAAVEMYPILEDYPYTVVETPDKNSPYYLEHFPPEETGSPEYPRPDGIPIDEYGLQIFKDVKPEDVAGDIISHHLVNTDEILSKKYQRFKDVVPLETMVSRYNYHKENLGEEGNFNDWVERTGYPELLRGYVFNQFDEETKNKMYTPEQIEVLDDIKEYITKTDDVLEYNQGGSVDTSFSTSTNEDTTIPDYLKWAAKNPFKAAKNIGSLAADFTPIVGEIKGGVEGAKLIQEELERENPNYYLVGAIGGMTAAASIIGLVPWVGDAGQKAIMHGAKMAAKKARRDPSKATKQELDPVGLYENRPDTYVDEIPVESREVKDLDISPRKDISIEDLQGKTIIGTQGDRTDIGREITGIRGRAFDEPVQLHGGRGFMRQPPYLWASDQKYIGDIAKTAQEVREKTGEDPLLGYISMAGQSGDYSTDMSDTVMELVKNAKISTKDAKEFDSWVIKNVDHNWRGILDPTTKDYLKNNISGSKRRMLWQQLNRNYWTQKGFPNMGDARVAITDPKLLMSPSMEMSTFGKLDSSGKILTSPQQYHPSYASVVEGVYKGDLPEPLPAQILIRDFFIKRRADETTKIGSDHRALMMSGRGDVTADVDQQMIDEAMQFLELEERAARESFIRDLDKLREPKKYQKGYTPVDNQMNNVFNVSKDREQALAMIKDKNLRVKWVSDRRKQLGISENDANYGSNDLVEKVEIDRRQTRKFPEQIKRLEAGEMSGPEYRKYIRENQPATKFTKEDLQTMMPKFTDVVGGLDAQGQNKAVRGIIGLTDTIEKGQDVSTRLDIPSYNKRNIWIAQITHGKDVKYGRTAVLKNVRFHIEGKTAARKSEKVRMVGKGEVDKTPFATMKGEWQDLSDKEAFELANKLIDDPDYIQLGFNPERHSFYYDKDTMMPVFDTEELVQIGPLVLAKKVKLGDRSKKIANRSYIPAERISQLRELKIPNKEGRPAVFNRGGAVMQDQMRMAFMDEGGLRDEGGQVEPTSGNEVPSGSLKEEVKDDIPTMLSEGEFVFPADVVRYIGLEKLMTMRQEAKMGLKRMEAMGQMGNSDEATIPDDLPFGMADLVVISGGKEEPKEMAGGGVLTGQQGLFADPRFTNQGVNRTQSYTPAQIENIRSGLGGQFDQIQEEIKPTEEAKTDTPAVTTPEVVAKQTPEPESGYDRRRRETRGFNNFIVEQEGHGGAFATIKQYADRDAVDWLKAATDINSLAGDIVTKLPIVGDLVSMSYQGARDYIKTLDKSKLDSDTRFAIEIFEKSKKPKGILSVLKDVFQGKTLKEAFTPEEYEQLTKEELAKIKEIRDRAKLEAKKRRDEYNNMSAADRTQRRQFLNVGVYNDGSGTIIQMKGDQVLYQTGGRNVYVNISDIIKQGDDPSLLMERILQKKPTFDSNGQYTGLSDVKPLPAYLQENANTGEQISNNLKVLKEEDMPPKRPDSIESVVASTEGEGPPLDVLEIIPSVETTLNAAGDAEAPVLKDFTGEGFDPAEWEKGPEIKSVENVEGEGPPLDVPEVIDPNITNLEKTVELKAPVLKDFTEEGFDPSEWPNVITLPNGTKIDATGLTPDQIANFYPKKDEEDKTVTTSGPASVSIDQSTVEPTEYASKGLEYLGESGIVGKVKDFGLSLFDSLKSSWVEGREKQKERDRQIALNIERNRIAREAQAARDEASQRAAKIAAAQNQATTPTEKRDAAIATTLETANKGKGASQKTVDIVNEIKAKQKAEADKQLAGEIDIQTKKPYVAPTAPTIKYDAPTGPFAKGG